MNKLWISIVIIQAFLIDRCEAYTTTWWSVWYFWVVLFAVLACCCGAAGSYYRRRQYASMRRTTHTVVVGAVPTGAQSYPVSGQTGMPGQQAPVVYPPYGVNPNDPYAPPPFPTSPVQPPSYSDGMGNQAYAANGDKDNMAPPPAYHEVVGEHGQRK